jgi:hypothetical protein
MIIIIDIAGTPSRALEKRACTEMKTFKTIIKTGKRREFYD